MGTKRPNGLGIYDMSGNVWEWVQDADGSDRVSRGGSWGSIARNARSSNRGSDNPDYGSSYIGFRLLFPLVQ